MMTSARDTAAMPDTSRPEPETTFYDNGRIKYRGAHLDGEMHGRPARAQGWTGAGAGGTIEA